MKIIDVINKAKNHIRLVAQDEEEAIDIAFALSHMKKRENAKTIDVTQQLLQKGGDKETLQKILKDSKRGQLFWRGVSYRMTELMSPDFERIKKEREKKYHVGYDINEFIKINDKWVVSIK